MGRVTRIFCVIWRCWLCFEKWLRPFPAYLATSPFFQTIAAAAAAFGFFVVLFTAYQIRVDLADRTDERAQRTADAIERAWTRLLRPAAGNTGKGEAVAFLLRNKISLRGVDLSCHTLGNWDAAAGKCASPPLFVDIEATGPDEAGGFVEYRFFSTSDSFNGANFSDVEFSGLKLTRFDFVNVNLARAELTVTTTYDSRISGEFAGATFANCRLLSTEIYPVGAPPKLELCDVSNATLPWLDNQGAEFNKLIAWADMPPLDISSSADKKNPIYAAHQSAVLDRIVLCKPLSDEKGQLLPLRSRGWLGTIFDNTCTRLTTEEAMRRFPASYRPKEFRTWDEIERSLGMDQLQLNTDRH